MFKNIFFPKKNFMKGSVIIAGAGPGDPNLITLKVQNCIKYADVIIYDGLVNKEILTSSNKRTNLIFAGKSFTNKSCTQEQIISWMISHAKKKKRVLRLKSGDPLIFGRGAEEVESLQKNKIPFQIFPGITSSQQAIDFVDDINKEKITEFCLITGHKAINSKLPRLDFKKIAGINGKLIIYMGLSQISEISKKLINNGRHKETVVEIIKNISLASQKKIVTSLIECSKEKNKFGLTPPVIIIIN